MAIIPEVGKRIRLLYMAEDPDPMPAGSVGTVTSVVNIGREEYMIMVDWDGDRTLNLAVPPDTWEYVS
jgi:hypothetical protein